MISQSVYLSNPMRYLFILLFALAAIPQSAQAQIIGAELVPAYSAKVVSFKAAAYYHCGSNIEPGERLNTQLVNSVTQDSTWLFVNADSIYLDTLTDCSLCGCQTGCLSKSIVKKTMLFKIDLNALGINSVCEVIAHYISGNRSANIKYIPDAENQKALVSSSIKVCSGVNNRSYDLALPPKFYGIKDDYFVHSPGFHQVFSNGIGPLDSLTVSTAHIRNDSNSAIPYASKFDPGSPMVYQGYPYRNKDFPSGFHVNDISGDVRFIPVDSGSTLIKLRFGMFSKGSFIGYAEREWQVNIINSDRETIPLMSGFDNSSTLKSANYELELCENDIANTFLNVIDDDANCMVTEYIPNYLSRAFSISRNADTVFLKGGLDSTYTFEKPLRIFITVDDSSCHLGSQSSYTLLLHNSYFPRSKPEIVHAGKRAFQLKSNPHNSLPPDNYEWRFNGNTYYNQDTVTQLKVPGFYKYKHIAYGARGCNDTTSGIYQSPDFPYFTINTTIKEPCQGDSLVLSATYFHSKTPPEFIWNKLSKGNFLNLVILDDTSISASAEFPDGTINYDTIHLKAIMAPEISIIQNSGHCEGNSLKLSAGYNKTGFNDSAISYKWYWNDRPYPGHNHDSTLSSIEFEYSGNIRLDVAYSNGCFSSTIKNIEYDLLYSPGKTSFDVCPGEVVKFKIDTIGGFTNYWYYESPQVAQNTDAFDLKELKDDRFVQLVSFYKDASRDCRFIDTLHIDVLPNLPISLSSELHYCEYDTLIDLLDSTVVSPVNGIWLDSLSEVSLIEGRYIRSSEAPKSFGLTYQTQHPISGCYDKSSTLITIHDRPRPQSMIDSLDICIGADDLLLNSPDLVIPSGGNWWGKGVIKRQDKYYFSTAETKSDKNKLYYSYAGEYGCHSYDSMIMKVNLRPNPVLRSDAFGFAPITAVFADDRDSIECTVDYWFWDFDDHLGEPCTTGVAPNLENRFCKYAVGQEVKHTYVDPGFYNVTLIVEDIASGIRDTAIEYNMVVLISSIDELSFDQVVVFPNPSSGSFNISQETRHPYKRMELFNSIGQSVHSEILYDTNQVVAPPEHLMGMHLIVLYNSKNQPVARTSILLN